MVDLLDVNSNLGEFVENIPSNGNSNSPESVKLPETSGSNFVNFEDSEIDLKAKRKFQFKLDGKSRKNLIAEKLFISKDGSFNPIYQKWSELFPSHQTIVNMFKSNSVIENLDTFLKKFITALRSAGFSTYNGSYEQELDILGEIMVQKMEEGMNDSPDYRELDLLVDVVMLYRSTENYTEIFKTVHDWLSLFYLNEPNFEGETDFFGKNQTERKYYNLNTEIKDTANTVILPIIEDWLIRADRNFENFDEKISKELLKDQDFVKPDLELELGLTQLTLNW